MNLQILSCPSNSVDVDLDAGMAGTSYYYDSATPYQRHSMRAVLADRNYYGDQPPGEEAWQDNHGPDGVNVLFTDYSVQFLSPGSPISNPYIRDAAGNLVDENIYDAPSSGHPENAMVGYAQGYILSSELYNYNDDLETAVEAEFGPDAIIAEWNDLKATLQSISEEEAKEWLSSVGISEGGTTSAFVTRGGERFHSGSRHYFIRRFDGNVSSGWAVHDSIHNNTLCLGSWATSGRKILVYIGED